MALISTHADQDDLGGGRFRVEQHIKRIAYYDGGSLVRSVNNFVDGDASWPHVVAQASQPLYTAADGFRRFHPTREADRYLEIGPPYIKPSTTWQKVSLGTATRTANRLAWTTTNANVYIDHGGHFIKMSILLKNGWVPPNNQVAFPVGLSGLTRSGSNILRDGVVVAHLTPPIIHDYDNPDGATLPIDWQFVNVSGQAYVLFTLPSLTGMSRPLVDPTLTLQPAAADGKDTCLLDATNWGVANALLLEKTRCGLIEFNASSILATASCTSAILYLYQAEVKSSAAWTLTAYSIAIGNAAWPEGIGWGNPGGAGDSCWNYLDQAPGAETPWAGSAGLGTSGTDYEASALGTLTGNAADAIGTEYSGALTTTRIAGWFGVVNTNYGLKLKQTTGSAQLRLATSDHATAGYRPKLVVEYTVPPRYPLFPLTFVQQDSQNNYARRQ